MRFFHQLLAVVLVTLLAVLGWDLGQRRVSHGDRQVIVYAGMFGPGEPMQLLYSGPPPQLEPDHPLGADATTHYAALMQAWPDLAGRVRANYQRAFQRELEAPAEDLRPGSRPPAAQGACTADASAGTAQAPSPSATGSLPGATPTLSAGVLLPSLGTTGSLPASAKVDRPGERPPAAQGACPTTSFQDLPLVERYRQLDRGYVEQLVETIGQRDRANRLKLFRAFAERHPQHDARLIQVFQDLHPALQIGLFEDFQRRWPQYEIEQRWDGRFVLSSNRPRFLTGTDVPDLVAGDLTELRILYRENLALPLDQPLPGAEDPVWREKGILYGPVCNRPDVAIRDTFSAVAAEASKYTIQQEDVVRNNHPYPAGTRIAYLWPSLVHTQVIFYNKAHFARIGRDPDAPPRTVEEFEDICRQLLAAGIEPIAQDGMVYIESWWFQLANRLLGYEAQLATCRGDLPRFAGPGADPRYLEIAQRLRRWRDENFWMRQFSASKWPGAQRDFGAGKCTFLLTGTWLPAEIARTRSYDPSVFDLSCFVFPACPGGAGSQGSISAVGQGHVITRQGKNHAGAAVLLNYLSAYGAELTSTQLHYISAQKNVAFPEEMKALEPVFAEARPGDIITNGLAGDMPLVYKFVLMETFSRFFPIRSDNLSPEGCVEELERKAQALYQRYGRGS